MVMGAGIHRAGPGHDGIGGGAKFEEVILVPLAAEGRDRAIGGGDFAIRGDGHVDKNEGQFVLRVACFVFFHARGYLNSKLKTTKLETVS